MMNQTAPDSPERVGQMLAQADALRRAGRGLDAERLCRDLLSRNPNNMSVLNYLALLVRDRGELGEAETLFRQAIAGAPREAALHNNLGNLLRRMGRSEEAETAFRTAISLKPSYPEALHNLGVLLREFGHREEALAAQRRAVALKPDYAEALVQLAVLLGESARHDEALQPLDAAIAARPDYFDAHYYRGDALMNLMRHDEAVASFNAAIALRPKSAQARHALGNALARARRDDEALEAYGAAVELEPRLLDAHRDYNALAWTMGRHDLNLTSYSKARARVGDTPDLLLAEANQRLLHQQGAPAEELLHKAFRAAPERVDVMNALARAMVMQNKYDNGIALLEQAIAANPLAVYNHRDMGIALLKSGQPERARRVLKQALAVLPFDQLSLAFLALAEREIGDSAFDYLVDESRLIGVYDIAPPSGFGDVESFNRALAEDLHALHTRRVGPFDQTLRGGTQTPGHLFDSRTRAIEGVRERIGEAVADYISKLPADPGHPMFGRKESDFTYSGAWSCQLRPSGYHTNHVHPEGWISSAYYVALPEAVADQEGKQGWLAFGQSNLELGERDRPSRTVQPAVGKLVLFPSYFWHGTVPFRGDDDRLTIAFDVVPGKVRPTTAPRDY
jgi:tetratricopeptide (TPR) repeat protein